jgi:hypothetical protein
MKPLRAGQLVTVTDDGATFDGIVVQTPSLLKVVVAVRDPKADVVMRTFHRGALRERSRAGDDDAALRRAMGKAAAAGGHGGPTSAQGRRGHTRAPAHRSTGR